jgi:hypothetical protein
MKFKFKKNALLLIFLISYTFGCSSTNTFQVTAKHASYPVSYTEGFFSSDSRPIFKEQYKIIHHFVIPKQTVTNKSIDLSSFFNNLIKDKGGDAIVNFVVTIEQPDDHVSNTIEAIMEGDVVKIINK